MQTALMIQQPTGGCHLALAWAKSGLMALSGPHDGPPVVASGWWLQRLEQVVDDIALLRGGVLRTNAAGFLGERAALVGGGRRGSVSVGGVCRMVAAADGVLAVSLARATDVEAVPAWLELGDVVGGDLTTGDLDVWEVVVAGVRDKPVAVLLERAEWLGLAVGEAVRPLPPVEPCVFVGLGPAEVGRRLVLDVSSLWAGPLCASLLGSFGLDVLKVEAPGRPDGARYGSPAFYERLNKGKRETIIDLAAKEGRSRFLDLCQQSAVVVDGLRPRVWANWGIDRLIEAKKAGLVWVSITGYGNNRAGFGDDTAVSGGLWLSNPNGGLPWFVGDAVADPVAGLVACRAAAQALENHSAGLIEVSMSQAVSWVRDGDDLSVAGAEVFWRDNCWVVRAEGEEQIVRAPAFGSH